MNYKEIWLAGYRACEEGKPLEANPYPEDEYQFEVWNEGWYDCDCDIQLEDLV